MIWIMLNSLPRKINPMNLRFEDKVEGIEAHKLEGIEAHRFYEHHLQSYVATRFTKKHAKPKGVGG